MKASLARLKRSKASGSDLQASSDSQPLNKYDTRALEAVQKGDLASLKSAMKKGAAITKVNQDGLAAIHIACHHGHMQLVDFMVQTEPSCAQQKDRQERTGVHHASKSGHLLCLQLLSQGQSKNDNLCAQDLRKITPLHFAASGGHLSVVKFLCEQNVPMDLQDDLGMTPLVYACKHGFLPVVRELLDYGAEINEAGGSGKTPLMWACEKGFSDIVDLLLRRGAQVDLLSTGNKTALDLASDNGYRTIRSQLQAAPKVASWDLGVQPGSKSAAVVTEKGPMARKFSELSQISTDDNMPSTTSSAKLVVTDSSRSSQAVAGAAEGMTREELITDLQERNAELVRLLERVTADNDVLEDKNKHLEEQLKSKKQAAMGDDYDEDMEGMSEDAKEQIKDLSYKLDQVHRELRRETDQRRKADEEVDTLKAQLSSYNAADERDGDGKAGDDLDFSDDDGGDSTLPGLQISPQGSVSSSGASGLLQAQKIISQLRGQVATLRMENESVKQKQSQSADSSKQVQALRAEVKQLQYEKSILADELDEAGVSSVPNVPLTVYEDLQQSKQQELDGLTAKLDAAVQKLNVQEEEQNRVVELYRQHLLAAALGYIPPNVQQLVAKIADHRANE